MARGFGVRTDEADEADNEVALSTEEAGMESFWAEIRESVAGHPDYDQSGYCLDDDLYRQDTDIRLVVDNSNKPWFTSIASHRKVR